VFQRNKSQNIKRALQENIIYYLLRSRGKNKNKNKEKRQTKHIKVILVLLFYEAKDNKNNKKPEFVFAVII
jgi:hypothetical protein